MIERNSKMYKRNITKSQAKSLLGFSVIASVFLVKKYIRYSARGLESSRIFLLLISFSIILNAIHQGVCVLLEPETDEENKYKKLLHMLNNKFFVVALRTLPIILLILYTITVLM